MKTRSNKETSAPRQLRRNAGAKAEPEVRLDAVEGAVGYHLRRALSVVLEDVGTRMRTLGLKPRDFTVMSVIRANPGINATRIADSLPMKRSNLSVLLVSLKRRGLVRRADGEDFARSQSLVLTSEGAALLETARRLHREHLDHVISVVGRGDLAKLIRLLRKLGGIHAPKSL